MKVRAKIVVGSDTLPKPALFSPKTHPDLILICYDTAFVEHLNKQSDSRTHGLIRPFYAPAKYALTFSSESCDYDIFCGIYLQTDEYMNKAVWFTHFVDIPIAINLLRERFPKENIPDQITDILDWPLGHIRKKGFSPGISIVTPVPPVYKMPEDY
jgi:hypothetical protein